MRVIVLIPAYNEEKNILNTVMTLKNTHPECDYLVINDGSTDNTLEVCQRVGINFITLPINLGIGGGVQAGYIYARDYGYDVAIQFDGDGQHDPKYIERLVEPIEKNIADVVIGSRYIDGESDFKSTILRRMSISFLSWLLKLCTGVRVHDVTSGFRAVNRQFIEIFAEEYEQDYPEPQAIEQAAFRSARILEVPVSMNKREHGKSSITLSQSVYYMIKVTIAIVSYRLFNRKGKAENGIEK